jgi:hypothetical protein
MNKFCLLFLLLFVSCLEKGEIDINLLFSKKGTLNVTPTSVTMLTGETYQYNVLSGQAPYSGNALGQGLFNDPTLEYTAPKSAIPINHQITLSDNTGLSSLLNIEFMGFDRGPHMDQPQSYGDQNYPMTIVKANNGDIFASAVIGDSPGWERWVTYKTTDEGLNWTKSDEFIMFDEGESHPMGSANKGNDIYICGYAWLSGGPINSEWFVRKTTDLGLNWTTADRWNQENGNNVCYDITVDSGSGNIYGAGYAFFTGPGNSGVIRQSTDDGATWSTIYNTSTVRLFSSIKTAPDGSVWAIGRSSATSQPELYKGTFAGTWTWNGPYSLSLGSMGSAAYQEYGDLLIESNSIAYYVGTSSGRWVVQKTTDGGLTWSNMYTDASTSTGGVSIIKLASGDLVSFGGTTTGTRATQAIRSTDNGATWTKTFSENTVSQQGTYVVQADDNSVIGLGTDRGLHSQIYVYRSTDNGVNWALRTQVNYLSYLFTEVLDYQEDGSGNIYTASKVGITDANNKETWAVMKSTDNGTTWTQSDIFTDPVNDLTVFSVLPLSGGFVYSTGTNGADLIFRRSTDNGATWSTLETFNNAGATTTYNTLMTSDSLGNIFYTGLFNWGGIDPVIRKATSNGTVRSTVFTFPEKAGSTTFKPLSLKALSDDSLWIGATERDGGTTTTTVIYKSLDQGTTWTEMMRRTGNSSNVKILRASDGRIFASNLGNLSVSTDNGTTWTDIYTGALGSLSDFIISSDDQVYIKVSDKVIAYSNHLSNWFEVWDLADRLTVNWPNTAELFECSVSPVKVCVSVVEMTSGTGSVVRLWPLKLP